ncbi:MAG TPA: low specificity L-threonine aldolase [Tissierellaceae bacterium]|nr:low specificity L-threonine aldolase [Tissierellaceae bacterium]
MKMFKSDNNSGIHPKVLEAIINANNGHNSAYEDDGYSIEAKKIISELFGRDVDVYFVTSGTASNVIGLSGVLKPFESVVCPDTAHINVDECGAFELFTGSKILYIPNRDGKIVKKDIEPLLDSIGDEHRSQPKVISISQTTELGTLYTVEEIEGLADFAHENNMLLHVDGARIANAVVALDTSFKEMITDTGVDLLSFGGTKNGMMIGEAIISLDKDLSKQFKFRRKQGMQLLSKMRFISAQYLAYLSNDLWKENARNANNMGQYLKKELSKIEGIEVNKDLITNMVFASMDERLIGNLEEEFDFYVTNKEKNEVRFVMSFDITKKDIDKFINFIKESNL